MGSKASKLLEEYSKTHSKDISLRELNLKSLPLVITSNFNYITKLNLSDNIIKEIPPDIYKLRALKIFWITNNKITMIPDEVGLLSELEDFQIDGNNVSKIGVVFFELKKIQDISLSRNQLKEIPVDFQLFTAVRSLQLENNHLTALPGCLSSMSSLKTLNVGHNQIEYIFNDFGMIPSLTNLSLFGNRLNSLPDSFGNLKNLQNLNLRSNYLTSLPDSFSMLTNLCVISLWDNQFKEFPIELTWCRGLVELSFSNNSIITLPPEIGKLVNLEKLYLQYNQIDSVPREIRYLTKLNHLLLHHNKITTLPCEIGIIPHLETINLSGNPLPSKILSMDLQTLLKYNHSEFLIRKDICARIIQRHYRIWRKQFRFRSLVMSVIEERRLNNHQNLVNKMSSILSSVLKIQRFYKSYRIISQWKALITKVLLFLNHNNNNHNSDKNIGTILFGFDQPDTSQNVVYYNPNNDESSIIKGATLIKLIEKLTDINYKEKDFIKYFFTTYLSFTQSLELFKLLCIRYHVELPGSSSISRSNSLSSSGMEIVSTFNSNKVSFYKVIKPRIQERVLELMEYWLKNHLSDFQENPKLLKAFNSFLTTTLILEKETSAKRLIAIFNETKKKHSDQLMDLIKLSQNAPKPILPLIKPPEDTSTFDILNLSTIEIARQMSLIDQTLLSKITAAELLSKKWSNQSAENLKICPNILNMISIFNHCSQWVASVIVSERSSKLRVKKLKFFIKVAQHCYDMRNFNGLMLVISGLSCSSITKLKGTWNALSSRRKERFDQLEKFVNMEGNFKLYRASLSEIPSDQPCIPFVGLYLMDLTFIDEGNPPFIEQSPDLINFVKKRLEANLILRFLNFKNSPYFFESVPFIQDLILNSQPLQEKDLYEKSIEIEKRHLRKINKKENKERKLASNFGDLALLANPFSINPSLKESRESLSGSGGILRKSHHNNSKKSSTPERTSSTRNMLKKGDVLTTSSPAIMSMSPPKHSSSPSLTIDLSSLSQNSTPSFSTLNQSQNTMNPSSIGSIGGSTSPRNRLISMSTTFSSTSSLGDNNLTDNSTSPLSSPRNMSKSSTFNSVSSLPSTPTSTNTPPNPMTPTNSTDITNLLLLSNSTSSNHSYSSYQIHSINF